MSDYEDANASFEVDDPYATLNLDLSEGHLNETASSIGDFPDLDSSLSFCSDASALTPKKTTRKSSRTSTPAKPKAAAQPAAPPPQFKVPAPIAGKCPECGKALVTIRGLENHILGHKWKRLTLKSANPEELYRHCMDRSGAVLTEMSEEKFGGKYGEEFNNYVKEVITKQDSPKWQKILKSFSEVISCALAKGKVGATFASSLRHNLYVTIGFKFAEDNFRDEAIDDLMQVCLVRREVAFPFPLQFLRKLGSSTLAYTFRFISGRQENKKVCYSKDDFNHSKAHKLVHYIAGSCIRSHLRHASKFPKNARLKKLKQILITQFTCLNPPVSQPKDKSYWTSVVNRKSLLFVNDTAFPFFLELSKLLQKTEAPDGSVLHHVVMDHVVQSESLLLMWEAIIGCTLSEDASFNLMRKMVQSMTNAFGSGIVKRRMNNIWHRGKGNKATTAVSHRAKLL